MATEPEEQTAASAEVGLSSSSDLLCADCGCEIGRDEGPPDGWQLEDGRTVCHRCCVVDFGKVVDKKIGEFRKSGKLIA